jgi:hypothetical protein
MSDMPLETCSAFNKFWNNKLYYKVASCWLFLLIHTAMHGSINIKFISNTYHVHFCILQAVTGLDTSYKSRAIKVTTIYRRSIRLKK